MSDKWRWIVSIVLAVVIQVIFICFLQVMIMGGAREANLPEKKFVVPVMTQKTVQRNVTVAVAPSAIKATPMAGQKSKSVVSQSKVIVPAKGSSSSKVAVMPAKSSTTKATSALPEAQENSVDDDEVDTVPQRYKMPSLKDVNLAQYFSEGHRLEQPVPFKSNKRPVLPENIPLPKQRMEVEITYMVEKDGLVKRADVSKSSGNEKIDNIVLGTIYKWRFKPMREKYPIPIPEMFVFLPGQRTAHLFH